MTKVKMVCSECGSDNVLKDAYAAWNVETQEWELSATFDNTVCDNCGAVDSVIEVEIEDAIA